MNYLTKLQFNTPIFPSITPKLLLNKIEQKAVIVTAIFFGAIALLCLFVVSHLKNRKAVEIQGKGENIDFENLKKFPHEENEKIEKQQVKKEQENKDEEKKAAVASSSQSLKDQADQVSIEQMKKVALDQKSKLLPKPIRETYEKNDILQVLEIYSKKDIDVSKKAECEAYFKNAFLLPKDKINIKAFYSPIDKCIRPEIVDMMLNAAFESLNNVSTDQAVKENIYLNFCEILEFSHPDSSSTESMGEISCGIYSVASITYVRSDMDLKKVIQNEFVNLLQSFLNHAVSKPSEVSGQTCKKTIERLFELKKPEEIVKIILNTKREPFDLINSILLMLPDEEQGRKVNELVEESLQSCTDAVKLGRLYDDVSHRNMVDLFSDKQMGILFQHWEKTTFLFSEYFEKISLYIDHRLKDKSTLNIRAVEDLLNANPNIDLKKLMDRIGPDSLWKEKPEHLLHYLIGFYVMRHLENNSKFPTDDLNKMFNRLYENYLYKSTDLKLASFLAERCSDNQIQSIIMGFSSLDISPKIRMIKTFLKAILKSNNFERIELAFANFWSCYKNFRSPFPSRHKEKQTYVEDQILKGIDSEDKLKAVYDACLDLSQNDEIKTLLIEGKKGKKGFFGTNKEKEYRVKLPLDVVKRIVK